MTDKISKTSTFAAIILFLVNFIILVVAILVIIFSLWMIASPTSLSAAIEGFGTPAMKSLLSKEVLTVHLGLSITGCAAFFLILSFMGLHGAVGRSPFLLFMYSALVLLLLLLECALFFYFSSSITEKGLQQGDGQWTHALRLAFECCERNSTSGPSSPIRLEAVPWSCCGTSGFPSNCSSLGVYADDCNKKIAFWLDRYETAIYASLAVVHLIVLSCSIIRRNRSGTSVYS